VIHKTTFQTASDEKYFVRVSSRFWYVVIDGLQGHYIRTISNGQVGWDNDENISPDAKEFIEQYAGRLWALRAFL
jgi:hypothetical protein